MYESCQLGKVGGNLLVWLNGWVGREEMVFGVGRDDMHLEDVIAIENFLIKK